MSAANQAPSAAPKAPYLRRLDAPASQASSAAAKSSSAAAKSPDAAHESGYLDFAAAPARKALKAAQIRPPRPTAPAQAQPSPAETAAPKAPPYPSSLAPRASGVRLRVEGRRLEKLIRELNLRGVRPRDMRRENPRALTLTINYSELKVFKAACVELNIEIKAQTPLGATCALLRLKRRAALPVCAALCVLMLGLISTRIWRVSVNAPDGLRARVETELDALGVAPGAAKSALDLKTLETAVSAAVPDVKFCQARVRGVTFIMTAQQITPAPESITLTPAGGLYARCDAVIERVEVLSGRAVVKRGDTVRAGDLLIAGEEAVSREGSAPVKALGVVTGRIWYTGRGEARLDETKLVRTGNSRARRALKLFGHEYVINPARGYPVCDRETTIQPIGGLFFKFNVETTRYFELKECAVTRDIAAAKAEAERLASQNAVKKCPDNATVIDKWTEYSIIEGNTIEANHVIETEETIQRAGQ